MIYLEAELRREDVTAMVAHAIGTAAGFGAGELAVEENGTMGFIAPSSPSN